MRSLQLALTLGLTFAPMLWAGIVQVSVKHTIVSATNIQYDPGNFVEYRTVEVSIGSPAQRFNLTLDTLIMYASVFDKTLQNTLNSYCSSTAPVVQRHLFDVSKSSTYGNVAAEGWPFSISASQYLKNCGETGLPTGDVGMDKVQVGSLSTNTNFGLIKSVPAPLQPFWASDGLLGLSRTGGIYLPTNQTWVNLATAATGKAVVTLAGGVDESTLTFGGDDTVNCAGKWTEISQADPSFLVDWHFGVKSIKIGTHTNTEATLGTVGSYTKTRVPKGVFANVIKWVGAEYDFQSDEYIVPCSKVSSMPDIVLSLSNGYEYRMPAKVYVSKVPHRKDGKCNVMLQENILVDQNWWTFGWHALTGKCWRFDSAKDTLSFADAKP